MKENSLTSVKLKFLFAILLYGTVGLFLRLINYPTDIVVAMRSGIGAATMIAIIKARHIPIDTKRMKQTIGPLILSGFFLGMNWICLFSAYRHTTVAIASLCNYTAPIIAILIAPLFLKERITWKKALCVAVAATGMILISGVGPGSASDANPVGIAFGMGAALAFVGIVMCNRLVSEVGAYERAAVQLSAAFATALVNVFIQSVGRSVAFDLKSTILCIILGVLHTGCAYAFYFDGLANLPLTTYAVLGYFEPVISVLISVIVLHEHMAAAGWIGTVCIIGAALASELITMRENPGDDS